MNPCVCCGDIIPEGRQVCPRCENGETVTCRITTCPFCGKVNSTRPWLNVLCPCGAKFYIHNREWWDRKTGKVIKEEE